MFYMLGLQLITTMTPGVPQAISYGYQRAGGTTEYFTQGTPPPGIDQLTVVFADNEFKNQLDERVPDWDERGWLVFTTEMAWNEMYYEFGEHQHELLAPKVGDG